MTSFREKNWHIYRERESSRLFNLMFNREFKKNPAQLKLHVFSVCEQNLNIVLSPANAVFIMLSFRSYFCIFLEMITAQVLQSMLIL